MLNYKQLVARFLNIPTYRIKSIDSSPDGKIHCQLTDSDVSHCPYCFKRNIYSKGYYSKFYTIPLQHHQQLQFNIKIKRYKCLICSKSFSDSINLTPKHSHLSYETIEGMMSDLKKQNETFTSIARNFNISETTVKRYFDKYYTPPKVKLPHVLCFDEIFIPSLNINSKYVTVMYDFENKKLVDLLMSRWKSDLGNYFSKIPKSQRNQVAFVCIDMYKTYRDISQMYLKKAIICIDSFHVIKNLNDSLDKIRLRIMKQFHSESIEYYLLKTWKFLLFDKKSDFHNKPAYNHKLKRYINKAQLLELLLNIDPILNKAFQLVEQYLIFNQTFDCPENKMITLLEIISDYQHSGIPELRHFSNTLYHWRNEICNSFYIIDNRRISNAFTEASNGIIKTIMRNAKGMHSFTRARKRIFYVINQDNWSIQS